MEPQSNTAATNGGGSFVLGVARIALGVFIGGLAALFAHDAIVGPATPPPQPPAPAVESAGTRPLSPPPAVAAQPAPEPPPPLPEPVVPPVQPQPPAEPPAPAPASTPDTQGSAQGPKPADDGLKNAQALAARLEAERQQRRADAWARFFQPSPVCRADPATRPCADAHLAARKRFDAQYVDR